MTDLVPFEYSDDRSYDEQMRDALEKALSIHGTVINDLNQALNCIIQMQRALEMCGVPNPHQAEVKRLLSFYKMYGHKMKYGADQTRRLLEAGGGLEEGDGPIGLVEGEIVDDG